jgi:hypothetical protein
MSRKDSRDIPFGPQFSPEQTALPTLLGVLASAGGDYEKLVRAIRDEFFSGGSATAYNRKKKADNTTLALRDYGILEADKATPTALGKRLIGLRKTLDVLYAEFAKHILLNLNGLKFVSAIQDENAAGRPISLETLPKVLARRGLRVPATGTHMSAMKGWLKQAGVFTGERNSYDVDADRLRDLLGGLGAQEVDALGDLDTLQRAFLRALTRFPGDKWVQSNEVAKTAETLYGVSFPWKSIKASVLDACEAAGLVESKKTTGGRGAKPFLVRRTKKFVTDVVEPILASYQDKIGKRLREYLRTPLADVVSALDSPSKHEKGKALEMLALALMFTLDLDFVDWRKRGTATGGAEVDVLVESARLTFSRWQIQCKNGRAALEDVAKEVGLAYHLNSNVVLVLTTRKFSSSVKQYAESMMRKSNLQIVLLDGGHLNTIKQSPGKIVDALFSQSQRAMEVKRLPESIVAGAYSQADGSTND